MRIAIDVMGGDHAPQAILKGSLDALEALMQDDQLVLVGDERAIRAALAERNLAASDRVEVVPTTQVIGMDEGPVAALKTKSDSSIARMAQLLSSRANDKRVDVVLSAGNTGAMVAAIAMSVRRLSGVLRPGIAVTMPTFEGPVILCDVGANPEPRADHLHQYAHMASVYAESVNGMQKPKVALLSIGGEESKGNQLVKDANKLMRSDKKLNYVGYIEGRELFMGKANVVICEGFTGNVVLKLAEGLSEGLFKTISHEIAQTNPDLAGEFKPIVKSIYAKHDYHEYGGAPLLGVNGVCMICHGSSEARTITNAIRTSINFAQHDVNQRIVDTLGGLQPVEETTA